MKQRASPNTDISDNKKRALQLAFAAIAFRHAQKGTRGLLDSNIAEDSNIYHCLVAGIATSYARPFQKGSGLDPLPSAFQQNLPTDDTGVPLQDVHNLLMEMRHKLFAHMDLNYIANLTRSPDVPPLDDVEVEISEEGFQSVETGEILPQKRQFNSIDRLLSHQCREIDKALADHLAEWCKPLPSRGRYKISDNGLERIP